MDENMRKRKRVEEQENPEVEGVRAEKPKEGLKRARKRVRKQKRESSGKVETTSEKAVGDVSTPVSQTEPKSGHLVKLDKKRQRREKGKAKLAEAEVKKARKAEKAAQTKGLAANDKTMLQTDERSDHEDQAQGDDMDKIDLIGIADEDAFSSASTATPSPSPESPVFDISRAQSGTSSISSIAPPQNAPGDPPPAKRTEEPSKPKPTQEELKARLQQRLDALRAARNADGPDGKPARSRQELMEKRRNEEKQRKQHKKELRTKAKEEERRQRELAIARGSPLLSPAVGSSSLASPLRESTPANNFSFGRVAFDDGQRMNAGLSSIMDGKKGKGPQDPTTALRAAENKKARINSFDEAKKGDIEEKDRWLNAKKRANGEKIRDDTSLLKKTLKRKESAKRKSEREWGERIEGVRKGQEVKQKRREENLAKRKEEKGAKKNGKGKSTQKAKKAKAKPRPGFEGSFRAGGKKK